MKDVYVSIGMVRGQGTLAILFILGLTAKVVLDSVTLVSYIEATGLLKTHYSLKEKPPELARSNAGIH